MYYKLVAELVMGRVCYGPSLYGPSWLSIYLSSDTESINY